MVDDTLSQALRDIGLTPLDKYRHERYPVKREHRFVGRGGEITLIGPEYAVSREVDGLLKQYGGPYQGTEKSREKLSGGEVKVIFRYWSAD